MSVRVFLTALVTSAGLVVAAACGGDGATQGTVTPTTAAPTTTAPTVSASPTTGAGRLLVYTKRVEMTPEAGKRLWPTLAIVTYDVSAERQVASFEVGEVGQSPSQVTILGNKIAVNFRQRMVEYDIDGSNPEELRVAPAGGSLDALAVSPDGSKLALVEVADRACHPQCRPLAEVTSLVFLDAASGQELMVIPQSAPGFAGFNGEIYKLVWRGDDRGVVVLGSNGSAEPLGSATVLLDGSVRIHDLRGFVYVAPNGRYAAHGFDIPGMNVIGHDLILRDLDSEADLASLHDDSLVFEPGEWSPDSTAYLYSTEATRPTSPGPGWGFVEGSREWHLLRIDGSPPSPVSDPEALRDQWYGVARPKLRCGDQVCPYPSCTCHEQGVDQAIDLYFGDTKVDSGMYVAILGYIQKSGT